MTRDELETAAAELRAALDDVDEAGTRERVERQADELGRLAEADRGPDHGRLARIDRILTEVLEATGSDHVATARERVRAYRETVEGV